MKTKFRIIDIVSARVGSRVGHAYRTSKLLRLITSDHEKWHFAAGSLRKQDWNDLKEKLVLLGIKITP